MVCETFTMECGSPDGRGSAVILNGTRVLRVKCWKVVNRDDQCEDLIMCAQLQAAKSCARRPLGKYVIVGNFRKLKTHFAEPSHFNKCNSTALIANGGDAETQQEARGERNPVGK